MAKIPKLKSITLSGAGVDDSTTVQSTQPPNTGSVIDETFVESYTFYIKSNISNAKVFINGEDSFKQIPAVLDISKTDLFLNGSKTIEAKCEGYDTADKYVISIEFPNKITPPVKLLNDNTVVGLSTAYLKVEYYDGLTNTPQLKSLESGNSRTLEFVFNKVTITQSDNSLITFRVLYSGEAIENAVKITKNNSIDFFPQRGINTYSDVIDSTFLIQASNPTAYKISRISISQNLSEPTIYESGLDESLSFNFNLDSEYEIEVFVESAKLQQSPEVPKVELVRTDYKSYNINSKTDFPILLKSTGTVTGVTVVINDKAYQFKDVKSNSIFGIDIPYSAFDAIGSYKIKVFPYLLNLEISFGGDIPSSVVYKEPKSAFDIQSEGGKSSISSYSDYLIKPNPNPRTKSVITPTSIVKNTNT